MLSSPLAFSQISELEATLDEERNAREKLNVFLAARYVCPICTMMTTAWDKVAEHTKRRYIRKGKQIALAVLEELAPQNSRMLVNAIQVQARERNDMDLSLLEALVECYENSNHWSSHREVLSIIADKVSFATLQRWIPDLSQYCYNIARNHLLLHGRGTELPHQKQTRMKVCIFNLYKTFPIIFILHNNVFFFFWVSPENLTIS